MALRQRRSLLLRLLPVIHVLGLVVGLMRPLAERMALGVRNPPGPSRLEDTRRRLHLEESKGPGDFTNQARDLLRRLALHGRGRLADLWQHFHLSRSHRGLRRTDRIHFRKSLTVDRKIANHGLGLHHLRLLPVSGNLDHHPRGNRNLLRLQVLHVA